MQGHQPATPGRLGKTYKVAGMCLKNNKETSQNRLSPWQAKGYFANFVSAKKLKIDFPYSTLCPHLRRDISPENQGEYVETSRQATRNLLIKW